MDIKKYKYATTKEEEKYVSLHKDMLKYNVIDAILTINNEVIRYVRKDNKYFVISFPSENLLHLINK